MSKKEDEMVIKLVAYIMLGIILLPIVLIYIIYKIIIFVIYGNSNIKYNNIKLSDDEKTELLKLDNMEGIEFEDYMTGILYKSGFKNLKTTKASGDHGADIIGEYDGVKYAFQCKRFSSKVGSKPIGEVLRGMNYYKCQKGIIITNNYFTKQAYNEAVVNNVELWDRDKLIQLIRDIINDNDNKKEKHTFIYSEQLKRLLIVIIGFAIVALGIYGINRWFNRDINENSISFYNLEDEVYNIANDVVNKEEFLVELSNSSFSGYEVEIDYIIKNYEHTLSEYEELFKNEVTKVYEKIKDKKIVYNTVFGKGNCYNIDICFSFNYQLSDNYTIYLGSLIMKYGDDNWEESFKNCMTEFVLTQEELDKMKNSLNR